jgi:hypothetical protein
VKPMQCRGFNAMKRQLVSHRGVMLTLILPSATMSCTICFLCCLLHPPQRSQRYSECIAQTEGTTLI